MASLVRTAAARLGSRQNSLIQSIYPRCTSSCLTVSTTSSSSSMSKHPIKLPMQSFSSTNMPPQTDDPQSNSEAEAETTDRASSRYILESLPESFTPGQALFLLQKKGGGGNLISKSDLTRLCEAARSGQHKDARIIQNALIQFQSCWKFELKDPDLTTVATESMLRAMLKADFKKSTDDEKVYFPDSKIKAGLYVAEAFTKRETGLYYSTKLEDVENVLTILWEGLQEYSMNAYEEEEEEEEEEGITTKFLKSEEPARLAALYLIHPDLEVPRRRIKKRTRYVLKRIFGNMCLPKYEHSFDNHEDILKITKEVFYTLMIRSAQPERKMKKKAKRAYLNKLTVADGPTEKTVELVANICAYVGGSSKAREIVDMWEKKLNRDNWDGSKVVDISKLSAVVDAWEQREQEQKESLNEDTDFEDEVDEEKEEDGNDSDDKKD